MHIYFNQFSNYLQTYFQSATLFSQKIDLSIYAEIWLALLALVFGTLIIVISIASQNIPKLIDFYLQDKLSIIYIWFIIIGYCHSHITHLLFVQEIIRSSSIYLSSFFLLTISILLSFPYIFYILKSTKPATLIREIFRHCEKRIFHLTISSTSDENYEYMQHYFFESLNQLNDLLFYVNFKEPKAQIIQGIGSLMEIYILNKYKIEANFFKIRKIIRHDISFKTLMGQFDEMEKTHTFFEQKCFRLLGNAYLNFLEKEEFDLASLLCAEITKVGRTAIIVHDIELLQVIMTRWNTLIRFAIKNGTKKNEGRNLYNAIYHYGVFVQEMINNNMVRFVKEAIFYLRIYGTEVFQHARTHPALSFIVDVFAAEMKKILMSVYNYRWDLEIQNHLLMEFLKVDQPPEFDKKQFELDHRLNNGVRMIQIGLGLFYLREKEICFVDKIVSDILEDLHYLDEETYLGIIELTFRDINKFLPKFWEDTDRGNQNIYFAPEKEEIPQFREYVIKGFMEKRKKTQS